MMVIVLAWLLLLNAATGLPLRVANPDKDLGLGQAIGQGSTPPTIHAIQNRAQTVRTLFLNASVEPGVGTATIEMVTMSQLLRDVPRFRSTLYCTYEPIVEEITSDTSSTALANLTTFHSVSLVQGIVPSTLEIPDTTIVMDPINTTSGPRLVQSNVVYLFPTLFQQLIVYGKYLRSVRNNTSIRVVAHPERVTDFRDSVLTMGASLDYSHIGIDSVVLYNNNITDALHPSATNIVLGLGSADVQLLVEFLEKNADAIVVITFDELTIFYTSLRTYYGSAYRPSMDRLRYVTNLPRWSVRPSSKRSTTFLEFFDPSVDAVRGPAALRTFATAFLVDFLSYDINSLSTPNALEDALYTNRVFSVDDELEFGPFRQDCSYPTMDSMSCLLNYGARNLRVWDFGSTYLTDSKALYGPITVYLIGDALVIEDGAFRKNWFLVVSGIVMGLNAIVLAFVAWGCASGRFDRSWEVVTVLHVGIHHHLPPCRVDELERALQNYSDRVDELYNTFHCLEVDSTSDAFTVVSRNASDLLCFADRLGPALHDVEQQMHLGPLLDLRMGLHTALCRCSRELDEEDLHPLSTILAPVKMLAQCLAQLGEGNGDVLLSQWACAAAVREQLPGELSLLGEYQLDRESTVMQVFRFVGESWSSREVPSTRKAKVYTPGDGEVQVAANPLKVQLSFSSDLFSNSAELTSQVLLF